MHYRLTRWLSGLVLGVLLGCPAHASAQAAEVVIDWNRIMLAAAATPGALPPTVFFTYPGAITHAAVFDALNSIDHLYTPFAARVRAEPGASREAAAAQAAHDVLWALFPGQRDTFRAALEATLAGLDAEAARKGVQVGAAAAREVLERRRFDGWARVPPQYVLSDQPGNWQPTPPASAPAGFTHYPDVEPFVIGSAQSYLVEPPPALTSDRYAADFNEVKALGGVTSTTRTEDQTLVARLFAGVGTTTNVPRVWNGVARDLARTFGLSGLDTARLFALLNMTQHDALLVSFTGKYVYGLWRPVTAIRQADRDDHPATVADPTWTPLITTPPYPSYPGNMACITGAGARLFARFFGRDDVAFGVTWAQVDGPGWTRQYGGFRQLADEAARSRIYGGIHYTFDSLASVGVCIPLADYAFDNNLRARFR